MGGAAQLAGTRALHCQASEKGAALLPISADCFMPIKPWHILHILGMRYTVQFLWGGQGEKEGREGRQLFLLFLPLPWCPT